MHVANDLDWWGKFDKSRLAEKDFAGSKADGGDLGILKAERFGDLAGVADVEEALDHVVDVKRLELVFGGDGICVKRGRRSGTWGEGGGIGEDGRCGRSVGGDRTGVRRRTGRGCGGRVSWVRGRVCAGQRRRLGQSRFMSSHAVGNGGRGGRPGRVVGVIGECDIRCRVSVPGGPLAFLRGLLAHLRRRLWPRSGKAQSDCREQRRRQLDGRAQAKQSSAQVHSSCLAFVCISITLKILLMGITTLLAQNFPKDLVVALLLDTRSTLNRTVFDSGRHCPARARRQHSRNQH